MSEKPRERSLTVAPLLEEAPFCRHFGAARVSNRLTRSKIRSCSKAPPGKASDACTPEGAAVPRAHRRDMALLKAAAGPTGEIRNRWPEWSAAWAVEGVLAFSRWRFEGARMTLEAAVALGARPNGQGA